MRTIHELAAIIKANVSGYIGPLKEAGEATRKFAVSWKDAASDISSAATRTAAAATGVVAAAVSVATSFQDQVTQVRTLLTKLPQAEFDKVTQKIGEMSVEFGRGTDLIANGVAEIISSGGDLKTVFGDLRGIMPMVIAGQADLGESVKLVATIVNAYKLEWTEAGNIVDKIFATNDRGVTSITALAGSMGNMTQFSKALGISLDEMMGSLASATKSAPTTAEAVTQLTALMRFLAKGTDEVNAIYQKHGFATSEQAVKTLGLVEATQLLVGEFDGELGPLVAITGRAEAAAGALSIAGENLARTKSDIEYVANAQGVAQDAMALAQKNGVEVLRQGYQSFIAVLREVGLQVLPHLTSVVRELSNYVNEHRGQIVAVLSQGYERLIVAGGKIVHNFIEMIPAAMQFAETLFGVAEAILKFVGNHPQMAAALALFAAGNMLGINQAVLSFSKAIVQTTSSLYTLGKFMTGTGMPALRAFGSYLMTQGVPAAVSWGRSMGSWLTTMGGAMTAMTALGGAYVVLAGYAKIYEAALKDLRESQDALTDAYGRTAAAAQATATKAVGETDSKKLAELKKQAERALTDAMRQEAGAIKTENYAKDNPYATTGEAVIGWATKIGSLGFADTGESATNANNEAATAAAKKARLAAEEALKQIDAQIAAIEAKTPEDPSKTGKDIGDAATAAINGGAPEAGAAMGKAVTDALEEAEKQRLDKIHEGTADLKKFIESGANEEQLVKYLEGMNGISREAAEVYAKQVMEEMKKGLPNASEHAALWAQGNINLEKKQEEEAKEKAKRDAEEAKRKEEDLMKSREGAGMDLSREIAGRGATGELGKKDLAELSAALTGLNIQAATGKIGVDEYNAGLARINAAMGSATQTSAQWAEMVRNGEITQKQASAFQVRRNKLEEQLLSKKISIEQFNAEMRKLGKETEEAAKKLAKETDAKKRAALLRGDFAGAGLDFRSAVEDAMASKQMERFNAGVQQFVDGMSGFKESVEQNTTTFQNYAQDYSAAMQGMSAAFGTNTGQIGLLYAQLAQLQSVYQMQIDVNRQQADATLESIKAIQALIATLESEAPVFTETNGPAFIKDPGLDGDSKSKGGGGKMGGAINMNFPNIRDLAPADATTLAATLRQELNRMGSSAIN